MLGVVYSNVSSFERACRLRLWEKCRFDGDSAFMRAKRPGGTDNDFETARRKYEEAWKHAGHLEVNSFRRGVSLANVASVDAALNRLNEARRGFEAALKELEQVRYRDGDAVLHELLRQDIATISNDLADVLMRMQSFHDAEILYRKSLKTSEQLIAAGGETASDRTITAEVVESLAGLGNICLQNHDYKNAEAFYKKALKLAQTTVVPAPLLNVMHQNLSHALQRMGRDQDIGLLLPNGAFEKYLTRANLARDQGCWEEAEKNYRIALAELRGVEDLRSADTLFLLGDVLCAQKKFALAEESWTKELSLRRRMGKTYTRELDRNLACLARLLILQNRPQEAEPLLLERLSYQESSPERARDLAEARKTLALVYHRAGKDKQAVSLAAAAAGFYLDTKKQKSAWAKHMIELAEVFADTGDVKQAKALAKKAVEILKLPRFANLESSKIYIRRAGKILGD